MQDTLAKLYATILSKRDAKETDSYTASLFAGGTEKIAKKLGEEAVETIIAAMQKSPDAVVKESADLLFHLLTLWAALGVTPEQIMAELIRREGTSGIAEKAARG